MSKVIEQNRQWLDGVWDKTEKKMFKVAHRSFDKIPYTSINGVHDDKKLEYYHWTNGFWGGMMWLFYVATKNGFYKEAAMNCSGYLDKGLSQYEFLYHDVGFMSHIVHGANYKITGDKESRNKNLFMAASLASRYNIDGGFIRAWNMDFAAGWSIVDNMMNLPILYWASDEIGDPRFKRIAMAHADMVIRDHIRDDSSIAHIVIHDTETGEALAQYTDMGYDQGYSASGCWSRGLAWAIYGMALSYTHTKEKRYLNAAKRTADYFLSHSAPYDYRALCDFCQPCDVEYYDSTASVCAACGILELAQYLSDSEKDIYISGAISLLKATDKYFCNYSDDEDALVMMGTERYPHNAADKKGLHIPIIYGDFFYVEALLKLKGEKFLIW